MSFRVTNGWPWTA